eukprot:CAMPEP_0113673958 /NCGR_PEP_ID=MMETSP0038_2-20120614/7140_1 /TAXON_ID=2898 /ORGANISM="Cryptomonas paramecium" /LENGTH=141 /DNA_ID=CAMNT_0000590461 /DNA_START=87 /DNA_END=512 /DNA_ORIENTATION=+ /assembly_acc=CAM_ASM_000170
MDAQMKQADSMRSVQAAMQIAVVRDQLQWGCGLYSLILCGATANLIKHRSLPPFIAGPLVLGGFGLSYLADMAYGTKMIRIRQEAEHILANEKVRLVPPASAPFRRFWEIEAAEVSTKEIPRVGALWPSNWFPKSPATKQN